ncbi:MULTISPECIES: hypothetical protein [Methylobacterium]|uniref:Uncharacterized protein n=2 Tax=Pseudomonadota TaxID=1224 RepID=A0ABQ4SW07_9HYPH|nr:MULTISPECIES: hypothetical protein [Methylobacterium]PIU06489.1 MAG: hypothetical protein COT56_09245 [Methylobacterium sp. CG09_land_8_20_14_0_10_71_15]PIU16427.1 MAG: hypothetical protein COT28_00325 [Methylobacterium sp. CG08_land_8_20_14_0_20_71_15]GBU16444.1 hypothetical protein AwMethylo_06590 [Methylobacterium sp.]GJE06053.1 hypothetical protein AOPFMNJM_1359 [Methylobacterium jeotgali]
MVGRVIAGLALAALTAGGALAQQGDLGAAARAAARGGETSAGTCVPVPQGSASVADLEALERAVLAVKDRLPFGQRNVAFVSRKAESFGDVQRKPDSVFAKGEVLRTYAEPLGYGLKPAPEGGFTIALSMDFLVKTAAGKVLAGQQEFNKVSVGTTGRQQPFFLNLSLNLTGIEPGDYVLTYTIRDTNAGKVTSFDQPFTIKG